MSDRERVDPAVMAAPSVESRPIEAIVGRNIARRAVYVAPVLIVVFGLIGGWLAAVSAAIGVPPNARRKYRCLGELQPRFPSVPVF